MTRVDVKSKRLKVGLSQLKLCDQAEVSRYKLQLHEQGLAQLSTDEVKRIMLVIKHAMEAARSSAAAAEKALAERLGEEQ